MVVSSLFYEIHFYIPPKFYCLYLCEASEVWNSGLINMVLPVRSMKLNHFYGWYGDLPWSFTGSALNFQIRNWHLQTGVEPSPGAEKKDQGLYYQGRQHWRLSPGLRSNSSSIPHSRFGSSSTANRGGHKYYFTEISYPRKWCLKFPLILSARIRLSKQLERKVSQSSSSSQD